MPCQDPACIFPLKIPQPFCFPSVYEVWKTVYSGGGQTSVAVEHPTGDI